MAEVTEYPLSWEDVEDLVHPSMKVEYDDVGRERWLYMVEVMEREWGYILSDVSALDLSQCETWQSIVDCIVADVGKEWDPAWEEPDFHV